jgi:uroporphyrinogen decarboxylase
MNKREVVKMAVNFERPPYVPWSFRFTQEARETLEAHYGSKNLQPFLQNHFVELGSDIGFFEPCGTDRFRDVFGVVWDRSIDKDIGNVEGQVLPEPTLLGYRWPNPLDPRFFADIPGKLAKHGDCYRVFCIGFSLFERAWTLRGLEALYMDCLENPDFVRELFEAIADYNIAQVREALKYDIDAVYFGDDWGQQHGLLMGYPTWKELIYPVLKRMYQTVRDAGKTVVIHSCGDVDELFDDLISIGVRLFNPFQPEVMNVPELMGRYRGRLGFWGGLSTQRTLPHGNVEDVRRETSGLIELGGAGGYVLSPAHAVEGDVPLANMLAFIEEAQRQPGYAKIKASST